VEGNAMKHGFAVREVLLGRDARAPEILSRSAVSRSYLLRRGASVAGLALIDLASFAVAVVLARRILANEHGPVRVFSAAHLAVMAAVLVGIFALHQLYGLRASRQNRRRQVTAALCVLAAALALDGVAHAWIPLDIVVGWLIAMGLLAAGRESFDFCLRVVFANDFEARRTVVLGSESTFAVFADYRRQASSRSQSTIIGIVGDKLPDRIWQEQSGIPALGLLADIEKIVKRARPDELMVIDHDVEVRHLVDLAELCREYKLTLKLADLDMRFSKWGVSLVPGLGEALFVSAPSVQSEAAWLLKRGSDIVLATVLLVLAAPLMAVIALAIKLTSPGPVFYVAERVGLGQRPFPCYKFRTMRADAPSLQAALEPRNEADGAIFKIKHDPRITAVGRPLRALSIDELPQLVNVLRGEMSLVGPRPLPLRDNELLAAWHKQRHVVLPGMTGPWQVAGRSKTPFAEMIRLDLGYIDAWSPWLDLSILLHTVKTVFWRNGV
jgi:exopolysaccharide biosynthesis polyprenyl glycosylphosphotransferase